MPKKKTTNPKSVASKPSPQNPSALKPRGTGDHRRRQEVRQTVKNACDQLNSEGVKPLLQCGLCIQHQLEWHLEIVRSLNAQSQRLLWNDVESETPRILRSTPCSFPSTSFNYPIAKVFQAQIAAERQRWKVEQESVASGRATPSTSKSGFRSAIHLSKAWGQSPGLVVQIHRLRG